MSHVVHQREARWVRRVLACATIIASVSACASAERGRSESEIATLRAHVEELRKSHDASAREIARVRSELEALGARSARLLDAAKASNGESPHTTTTLAAHDHAIVALRAAVDELRKPVPPLPPPPPARTMPPQSAVPDVGPEQLFATAMTSFQAEEHGQAVLEWSELTRRFAEHPLASSAQYWIGEAYYRQRDFRQAMLEFRKVIDGYAKSAQTPDALLKIGLCQRGLRDVAHARETWEQLTKEYPGTTAATQARSLLGGPGTSSRSGR